MEHPREVAQVEDVVELGRGGRQVLHDVRVQLQRAARQPVAHGDDALVEHLDVERAHCRRGMAREAHVVRPHNVNRNRALGVHRAGEPELTMPRERSQTQRQSGGPTYRKRPD